jgi:MinD superfamily P-loop ATPase
MSFKIAIASGKGGTGKTSISVTLHHFLQKHITKNIQLVDCDVEEPNDILFYPEAKKKKAQKITQLIPKIDTDKCVFCKKCADFCEFNAINIIPNAQLAEVNTNLCHSCGACTVACEYEAITEIEHPIGKTNYYQQDNHISLIEGVLKIGSPMQTMVIKEIKSHVDPKNTITLYDAPPGTSCPVVETISDTDYVILVTEPTPFGLHDLKLMIALLDKIQKPFGLIVNKAGLGNNDVYEYIKQKNIELLGEIPFDHDYAAKYAKGDLLINISEEISDIYNHITNALKRRIHLC